jgi:uncharacterized protein
MKTELFSKIIDFLQDKIDPVFIIVFGSYAKGYTHSKSDIDIAFYSKSMEQNSYELFIIAQELASLLNTEVDLVNLHTSSTVFKAQIYTTGTVIFSNDDIFLKNEQMTTLSMYARLNEERAEILKTIYESGTIYE